MQAAMTEGVVPGGGATLVYMLRYKQKIIDSMEEEDERLAVEVLFRAITAPIMQIAENCGVEGEIILERVRDKEFGYGWNAATDSYEDLLETGVIDPATVTQQV